MMLRHVLTGMAALVIGASAAAGQASVVVRGRVIGADNAALAQQAVVLHKVQGTTGTTVAGATTDDAGAFELSAPAVGDTTALYFIAARYNGELYIGSPFRESQEDARSQVLQVGVAGTSATAILEGTGAFQQPVGRPLTSRSWLLFAIPLFGVAAVAVYMLFQRDRLPRERAMLIRIAELDERVATAPAGQRETLQSQRVRLLAELRGS